MHVHVQGCASPAENRRCLSTGCSGVQVHGREHAWCDCNRKCMAGAYGCGRHVAGAGSSVAGVRACQPCTASGKPCLECCCAPCLPARIWARWVLVGQGGATRTFVGGNGDGSWTLNAVFTIRALSGGCRACADLSCAAAGHLCHECTCDRLCWPYVVIVCFADGAGSMVMQGRSGSRRRHSATHATLLPRDVLQPSLVTGDVRSNLTLVAMAW